MTDWEYGGVEGFEPADFFHSYTPRIGPGTPKIYPGTQTVSSLWF